MKRVAAALGVGLLAACGPSEPALTELVLWHAYRGAEKAALEAVVDIYNADAAERGVRLKTLAVPFDAYADKISAAAPRGRGPDLFIFGHDRLGGWVEAGDTVEPIGFFVDDAITSRHPPEMLEPLTYRGALYGLPVNFKTWALIYNRELVPDPPRTTEDLERIAAPLTDLDRGEFGFFYDYNKFDFHAILINGFGGGVFEGRAQPAINQTANRRAYEQLLRWRNDLALMPPDPSSALVASLFNQGRVGMTISGPWFFSEADPALDIGVARLPQLSAAQDAPMRPWLIVEAVFVTAGGQNVDAAFDAATFLTSATAGRILARDGGQLPANRAVLDDPELADDPVISGFRDQLNAIAVMPNAPEMALVWSPAEAATLKILRGTNSPEDALDEAQASLTAAIDALNRVR